MVSDLLFLSSTNHVQTLRHIQSHYSTFTQVLHYLVIKSQLISMYGMIDVATMQSTQKADSFGCTLFKFEDDEFRKQTPVIITTKRIMVSFTELGLYQYHHKAFLIKNVYCNCETPILFQLLKHNLATLFQKWKKKGKKEKKKNNNRCIIVIQ